MGNMSQRLPLGDLKAAVNGQTFAQSAASSALGQHFEGIFLALSLERHIWTSIEKILTR